MNSKTVLLLAIGCVLLLSAWSGFRASATQDSSRQPSQARWEHLAMPVDDLKLDADLSKTIIRLGNEGWELVTVMPIAVEGTTKKSIYYFKRPK